MDSSRQAGTEFPGFDPTAITRPHRRLLSYYVLASLLTGPLFPFVFLPLFFKYETLRYRFDASGIAMSWGILFRRETYLTYRRIQDIHLSRNLLQRWMGLATVAVQTASGSATPEMSIEGILEAEALRDHLYNRMRGVEETVATPPAHADEGGGEALALLQEIRDLLRARAADRGDAR
ncbi:MAG: PH domain-containing protein [Candidatus Hydrogenedentes bacterium]|nr:PH domain-containing protein [Candidatus Hydrogenedentota bacterium]